MAVPMAGRCMWVFPSADSASGLVAVPTAARCADLAAPVPITVEALDADYLALQAAFYDAHGATRVLVRGWRFDPLVGYGVRAVGVGLGRMSQQAITLDSPWLFGDDLDLGDAALVYEGHLYAYGCPGAPHGLEEDCIVGRARLADIDSPAAWLTYGSGGWGVGSPQRVFGSGPHRGPVVRDPAGAGFLHAYAIGFGSTLELTRAERPEGPWQSGQTLLRCTLPRDDPGAYCAGPIVHLELHDPTRPHELVVTYSVGTTSADGERRRLAAPRAYWPRTERVTRPARL